MDKLKELLGSKRDTVLDIVVILLIGLLPLTWFKKNLLIYGTDFAFPLVAPTKVLSYYFFAWNSLNAPGAPATANFTQILYQVFLAIPDYFGLSLVTIEKLYFVISFAVSGLSMYYLTSVLIKGEKRRVAALTS